MRADLRHQSSPPPRWDRPIGPTQVNGESVWCGLDQDGDIVIKAVRPEGAKPPFDADAVSHQRGCVTYWLWPMLLVALVVLALVLL